MRGTSPISMAPTHCCSRAPNVYTQLLSRHQRIVSFKLISSKLIGNLIAPIARTQEINWYPSSGFSPFIQHNCIHETCFFKIGQQTFRVGRYCGCWASSAWQATGPEVWKHWRCQRHHERPRRRLRLQRHQNGGIGHHRQGTGGCPAGDWRNSAFQVKMINM